MPFVAINASNLYDASNLIPYVTQEQADTLGSSCTGP